jgi:hypothetical protein
MSDRLARENAIEDAGPKGKGPLLSKSEAGYRVPDVHYPCGMCRRFDGYRGACSVVAGLVRPDATCNHWRSAEDPATERRGFV